jgi:aminoglycoside phosphotransferase (APT) family kinase protein
VVRPEAEETITNALGSAVIQTRTLADGFSHETSLMTLTDGQVVVRLGRSDPAIEAAVMAAAGNYVPVPQVLGTLPASADGARAAMLLEHVRGTLLSDVLARDRIDRTRLDELGAEVGRLIATISQVKFDRPGFFADAALTISPQPPWSTRLAGIDDHTRLVHSDVNPKNILSCGRCPFGVPLWTRRPSV